MKKKVFLCFIIYSIFFIFVIFLIFFLSKRSFNRITEKTEKSLKEVFSNENVLFTDLSQILKSDNRIVFGLVLDKEKNPVFAWETKNPDIRIKFLKNPEINKLINSFKESKSEDFDNISYKLRYGFYAKSFTHNNLHILILFKDHNLFPVVIFLFFIFFLLFLITCLIILIKDAPSKIQPVKKDSLSSNIEKIKISTDLEKLTFFREVALATNSMTDFSSILRNLASVFSAKFPEHNIVFYLNTDEGDEIFRPVIGIIGGKTIEKSEIVQLGYKEIGIDEALNLCEQQNTEERTVVPLKDEYTLYGIILLENRDPSLERPDVEEINFVSKQIAMAIRNAVLYHQAITDGLTELFSHRYFQIKIEEEVKRFKRKRIPFSIFLMDIDNFKRLNDTFGHQAGDFVLHEVSKILTSSIRSSDLAFRYGGEEFAIIFSETDLEDAWIAAEKIRKNIENFSFIYEDTILKVTISGGVATYNDSQIEIKDIIKLCDIALYRAKEQGKNQVIKGDSIFLDKENEII